jgi:hypothetical protein
MSLRPTLGPTFLVSVGRKVNVGRSGVESDISSDFHSRRSVCSQGHSTFTLLVLLVIQNYEACWLVHCIYPTFATVRSISRFGERIGVIISIESDSDWLKTGSRGLWEKFWLFTGWADVDVAWFVDKIAKYFLFHNKSIFVRKRLLASCSNRPRLRRSPPTEII